MVIFMKPPYIPEEVIRNGYITLYRDDIYTIDKDVAEYNKYIAECKTSKARADSVVIGYRILTPVTLIAVFLCNFNTVVYSGALAFCMLGVYLLTFVYFGMLNRNLIFASAAAPLLLLLELQFIALLIADVLFTILYEIYDRPLRGHLTYPVFYSIDIRYSREKRPKDDLYRY
ncbi:MAG: hypothetical protein K2J80_12390 [Oscillospiraceae bacterium]|nr:hypothetical protein [Oscillospiraceae bacterium]